MRLISPVLTALARERARAAPLFAKWSELSGAPFCPARPADIARFVSDCAPLGVARLLASLREISRCHEQLGLADPTLGAPVAAALDNVAGVEPPRSWASEHKLRFKSLPYEMQMFIASHEAQREKALRRAQNEAAAARQRAAAGGKAEINVQEKSADETDQCSSA